MTNSIALAEKFVPVIDRIYKETSKTEFLDSRTLNVDRSQANIVSIMKVDVVGQGDYSKTEGYPKGDTDVTWEDLQLLLDRGRELNVDRMDNEETLGLTFGAAVGEYMRTHVVPETDAVRFARYYTTAANKAAGTLTSSNVLAALDAGHAQMDTDEVPMEGRVGFLAASVWRFLNAALDRQWDSQSDPDRRVFFLDGVQYVPVPQGRFFTAVTLDAGATTSAGGFSSNGTNLNFLLLHTTAIWQAIKFEKMKIFLADINQDADNHKAQYRQYHDADVFDNKVDGVYGHAKSS